MTLQLNKARRRLDVGVDVDDVLANFRLQYWQVAQAVLERPLQVVEHHWDAGRALGLTLDQRRKVTRVMQSPGVCRNLPPIDDAVEGVRVLTGIARRVFFVTAPWRGAATWASEREGWLLQHFGKLGANVISTRHKYMVNVNVLIDDKPQLLDAWLAEPSPSRMRAVCWARDYNEDWVSGGAFRTRTRNWDELHELVYRLS